LAKAEDLVMLFTPGLKRRGNSFLAEAEINPVSFEAQKPGHSHPV
jgi:hypothetical protein